MYAPIRLLLLVLLLGHCLLTLVSAQQPLSPRGTGVENDEIGDYLDDSVQVEIGDESGTTQTYSLPGDGSGVLMTDVASLSISANLSGGMTSPTGAMVTTAASCLISVIDASYTGIVDPSQSLGSLCQVTATATTSMPTTTASTTLLGTTPALTAAPPTTPTAPPAPTPNSGQARPRPPRVMAPGHLAARLGIVPTLLLGILVLGLIVLVFEYLLIVL